MLKCPRKEEGKKEKEAERRGKKGKKGREERKERERKKERKEVGKIGVVYWYRRMCANRNEGAWLATRKKAIFKPWIYLVFKYLEKA